MSELTPMTGKENVIKAMRLGARLFLGGYARFNRLKFEDGSYQRVHGKTANALIATRVIGTTKDFDPWSATAQEWILKD